MKKNIQESKYNYCVRYEDSYAFFNGRTKRFFFTSEKTRMMFADILRNPTSYFELEKYRPFIEKMKTEGFVVDTFENEYQMVMEEYRRSMLPDVYRLMILPTYKCNMACWYCLQEHYPIDLSKEMIERTKKHIRNYLLEHRIKKFHLSWFGGEPLLQYDVVCELTEYSKKLCEELRVEMDSGITTNGTLLTKERIAQLKLYSVNFFQITIDGTREEHNKVKILGRKDTFTITLNNIVDILTIIPEAGVTLRINYSSRMKSPRQIIDEINELIPHNIRPRINLNIQKVWQEDDELIEEDAFRELITYSQQMGFSPTVVQRGKCYVENYHYNTIFPDGTVDICDHEGQGVIGRATLDKNGDIKWKEELPCFQYSINKENVVCNSCRHLPMCYGPCPAQRNSLLGSLQECPYENIDETIEREIVNFIATHR